MAEVVVDHSKKSVILEGLNELAENAVESIQEIDEMKMPGKLIARISMVEDDVIGLGCKLQWVSVGNNTLSRDERMGLIYSHNLDSVAEYEDDQTLTTSMNIIFATFECIRVGLDRPFIYICHSNNGTPDSVYI